jgi:Recombination enhancement, RecA-dependent nuclease
VTRGDRLKLDVGCIVTRLYFGLYAPPDIHHLTAGGRRLGDEFTIPLSPWYHRGVPIEGMTQKETTEIMGPSLAKSRRAFEDRFGSQWSLLEATNAVLAKLEACRAQ